MRKEVTFVVRREDHPRADRFGYVRCIVSGNVLPDGAISDLSAIEPTGEAVLLTGRETKVAAHALRASAGGQLQ